ncbi:hypothetical protein HZA85_01645 [Candidatus Uhrbacteria bacterium]|nr:hypothetical protein [Candidatus Uhrbacteria bacterium]
MKTFSRWLLIGIFVLLPVSAWAGLLDSQLSTVGSQLGKDGGVPTSLPVFIGGLINVVLSVLGLVFLVLIVYAGYMWMTASGDSTKVDKAKKLIGQALIGMIIVIASYAISAFVIDRISGAITVAPAAAPTK